MTTTRYSISKLRVVQILSLYGSDSNSWPQTERAAAIRLIESSSELQSMLKDAKFVDSLLEKEKLRLKYSNAETEKLLKSIQESLPLQESQLDIGDSINLGWLQKNKSRLLLSVAASVLLFSILLSLFVLPKNDSITPHMKSEDHPFDLLVWQESSDDSLAAEDVSSDFLGLIEMEILEN